VGSLLVLVFAINKQPRLDSSVKDDNDRLRVSDDNDDGDNGGRTKKGEFSSFQISLIHETFQRSQTPCPFNSNEFKKSERSDSLHSLQSIKYNNILTQQIDSLSGMYGPLRLSDSIHGRLGLFPFLKYWRKLLTIIVTPLCMKL
jgi:hypothetical protein